ncbi:MAG: PAS domain S-box protein [Cytophagaceae bacterium]
MEDFPKTIVETSLFSCFNNNQELYFAINNIGEIRSFCPNFKDFSGYTDEELNQKFIYELFPLNERNILKNLIKSAKNGEGEIHENHFLCKNGSIKTISWSLTFINKPNIYFAICRDTTKKNILEKEILTKYKEVEKVLSLIPEIIICFDSNNKIVKINNSITDITGIHSEFYLNKFPGSLNLNDQIEKQIEKALATVKSTGKKYKQIFHFRKERERIFEGIFVPEFNDTELSGIILSLRDVSKYEEVNKFLEATHKQHKALSDVGKHLLFKTSLSTIFEKSVRKINFILDIDSCYIAEYNLNDQYLKIKAGYGLDEVIIPSKIPYDTDSLAAYVLDSNKPVIIENIHSENRFNTKKLILNNNLFSGIFTLIKSRKGPCGILCIESKNYHNFQNSSISFIESFANLLAAIKDKKYTEQKVVKSERSYKDLFNYSSDFIFILNKEGKILDVNNSFLNSFQLNKNEIAGKEFSELSFFSTAKPIQMFISDLSDDDQKFTMQSSFYNSNVKWIEFALRKGTYFGKEVIIANGRDITQIKLSEENSKKSRAMYKALVNTINDGILFTNEQGLIQFSNNRFHEAFEYLKDSEGKTIDEIFKEFNLNIKEHLITNNRFIKNTELEITTPKGNKKWFLIDSKEIVADNLFNGYLNTFQDITERRSASLLLKEKNEELNTFIYKVSHDLKGPLSSVNGLISLIRIEKNPDAIWNYLSILEKCIARMENILFDLLEITKIQSAKAEKVNINLRSFTKEIIESLQHIPNVEKIRIEIDIPENLTILAAKNLISSVLQNIIINAFKYHNLHKNDPYVKVVMAEKESHLEIVVSDNGPGIDQDSKNKVFDMFFRANSHTEGSGLGLYIVKNALKKLEGSIHLESDRHSGTSFFIKIPIN